MHNSKQTVSDTFEKLSVSASQDREVYIREHPPAHYSIKFTSFSLLEHTNVEKYDSGVFEAEGFKWRLSLYPNGDKKRDGAGHLSLYLAIEETGNHTHGWEVNAIIKFFIFDQTRNSYLTIQDANGAVMRFHEQKKEWGFSKLMMLETFKQASRGYLVDDTCVFGAEVFVVAPSGNWESHAMVKPRDNKYAWKIENFSKLDNNNCFSHRFFIGNQHWQMRVYPKGTSEQYGKCLSVYLGLVGAANEKFMLRLSCELWINSISIIMRNQYMVIGSTPKPPGTGIIYLWSLKISTHWLKGSFTTIQSLLKSKSIPCLRSR